MDIISIIERRHFMIAGTSRNLGLGFGEGNQFTISMNEPNKPMINALPFPSQVMDEIRQVLQEKIQAAEGKKQSPASCKLVEDILIPILKRHHYEDDAIKKIIPTALALFIPDVLIDMNVTRLSKKVIPEVMKNPDFRQLISESIKNFLHYDDKGKAKFFTGERYADAFAMKNEEDAQVSLRFLKSIIVSKFMKDNPGLVPKQDVEQWKDKVFEEQLAYLYSQLTGKNPSRIDLDKVIPKINLDDNQVYAYLIPAIVDRMNDEALKKSAVIITPHLNIHEYKPIAFENYFNPEIKMAEETVNLSNQNQRSLQFFARANKGGSLNSSLTLRDKVYRFQHTHIHFERDGEEKEYQVKDKEGKIIKFDGEVHNVFEYILPKEENESAPRKRLLALGSPLQIVDIANPAIQELLDEVNKIEQSRKSTDTKLPESYFIQLQKKIDFGKVFMNSINTQNGDGLIYHSWASLRSSTHGFQSGLRFLISTQPIQVSREQYDSLRKLFGTMRTNLQEDEILDPIDRKAGWRKERAHLQKELKNLSSIASSPTIKRG